MAKDTQFISVADVAKETGLTKQWINRKILAGSIPAQKVGKQYVIPVSVLKGLSRRCKHCGQVDPQTN